MHALEVGEVRGFNEMLNLLGVFIFVKNILLGLRHARARCALLRRNHLFVPSFMKRLLFRGSS